MFHVLLLYFPGVWQRAVLVKKQGMALQLQIVHCGSVLGGNLLKCHINVGKT